MDEKGDEEEMGGGIHAFMNGRVRGDTTQTNWIQDGPPLGCALVARRYPPCASAWPLPVSRIGPHEGLHKKAPDR